MHGELFEGIIVVCSKLTALHRRSNPQGTLFLSLIHEMESELSSISLYFNFFKSRMSSLDLNIFNRDVLIFCCFQKVYL